MRHWAWSAVAVVCCLPVVACRQAAPLSDQDKAAIQKANDEYGRMLTREKPDMAALVKMYYTDTARMLPPGEPAVVGQAAITKSYVQGGPAKTFKSTTITVEGRGDLAYVEGAWEDTYAPAGGGEPIFEKGKSLEIFQKQADGSWKAVRDIWNSDAPEGLALPTAALKADASAELKALAWFAGKWTIEMEATTASPLSPAGRSSLTMDCRWFPGGTSLFCVNGGTTPLGPYHEVMSYTYDADAKAYRGYDVDNAGMASPFALAFAKDTWTFSYDLKVGGKPAKGRMTLSDLSQDGCSFRQEMATGGGAFTLVSQGKARKLHE